MKESYVQLQILDYLALKGIFHYRNNSGGFIHSNKHFCRFGALGSPDVVAVIKGRFVGIEVKTPTGRQSDHQKAFQENLSKAGGIYFLVRSLDEAVEAVEDAIKRSRNRILDP
jgi:hypothetical protein